MNSTEIRPGSGDAESVAISNPHANMYKVVRSSYLSRSQSPHASEDAWYVLADPKDLAAVEIVTLTGKVEPTIDSAEADFNILGISMRGYSDFGIALQDPRAVVRMRGS